MKKYLVILIILFAWSVNAQELSIKEKIKQLESVIPRQRMLHQELGILADNLRALKKQDVRLLEEARTIHNENLAKVGLKGLVDLLSNATAGTNPVLYGISFCKTMVDQLVLEPILTQAGGDHIHQSTDMQSMSFALMTLRDQNSGALKYSNLLEEVIHADILQFHSNDKNYPMKYPELKQYWESSTNELDNDIEMATRKLQVIIYIATKARDQVHDQILIIEDQRADLNKDIRANQKELERLRGLVDDWDPAPDAQPLPELEIAKPVVNNVSRCKWCVRKFAFGDGRPIEISEEEEKMYETYYLNGYRYDTRLNTQFPKEITLGEELDYSIELSNPNVPDAESIYVYQIKKYIDGKKTTYLKSQQPGMHKITILLYSCKELIDSVQHDIRFIDPIEQATVYFEDPKSEIYEGDYVWLKGRIDHPTIEDADRKLKYTFKWFFDDKEIHPKDNTKMWLESFCPSIELLTPGIHETRIQLFDRNGRFIDQYLHRLTVVQRDQAFNPYVPQTNTEYDKGTSGQIKEQTYDPELEGKRIPALDLQWAKYDYVFKNGEIKIDGYYYWNYQKVNYTSEPILNYVEGSKTIPGMVLTKTSGYHIYPTKLSSDGSCPMYIITEMKGANIKIMHRMKACDFNMKMAPDNSKITITYKETATGPKKTITLL